MIYVETANGGNLDVPEREILRYAGVKGEWSEDGFPKRLKKVKEEVLSSVSPRACYLVQKVHVSGSNVDFGSFQTESSALSKSLAGCDKVLLFGATVGAGADRILLKYSRIEPSSALLAQATATAAVERWCDVVLERVKFKLAEEGMFLRPRFSPGYGDFSIGCQKALCRLLDTPKHIGVTLTDALMMTPTKSVTAVAGISSKNENCVVSGCETCEKQKECLYA